MNDRSTRVGMDDDGVIEIELGGPRTPRDPEPDATDHGATDRRPNRQRRAAVAAFGCVVLGAGIAAVLFADGATNDPDDSETAISATNTSRGQGATEIAAPPTLPPVERLTPTTEGETGDGAPTPPADATAIAASGLEFPDFPTIDVDATNGEFVLSADSLHVGDAAISTMSIAFDGSDDDRVSTAYDGGRARIWSNDRSEPFEIVLDIESGAAYTSDGESPWESAQFDAFGTLGLDLVGYVEAIVLGPVRADTVDPADLVGTRFVELADGEPAREFVVVVSTSDLAEWSLFYAPGDAGAPAPERQVTFHVYVTRSGELRQVVGLNSTGPEHAVLSSYRRVNTDSLSIVMPDGPGSGGPPNDGDGEVATVDLGPVPRIESPSTRGDELLLHALNRLRERPYSTASVIDATTGDIAATSVLTNLAQSLLYYQRDTDDTDDLVLIDWDDGTWLLHAEPLWLRFSLDDALYDQPFDDAQALVAGLVGPEHLLLASSVEEAGEVRLIGDVAATRYDLDVPADSIAEPFAGALQLDRARRTTVHVYVIHSGRVGEIHVHSNLDGFGIIAIQRFNLIGLTPRFLPEDRAIVDMGSDTDG